jgi:hypothetical protein
MRYALTSVLLAGLALAAPAHAQRQPLNEEEQRLVNRAIDDGVAYLKKHQSPNGVWPRNGTAHAIGYTALPALTLLECGVPPDNAIIQRAAHRVRQAIPRLGATYEISLALLFLDRLGDRRDRDHIRTLAVRLIAGQTTSGGWGYRCPTVNPETENDILMALKRLERRPPFVVQVGPPEGPRGGAMPDRPGPGLGGFPVGGDDRGKPAGGVTGSGSPSPGATGSMLDQNAPAQGGNEEPGWRLPPGSGRRWSGCIKLTEGVPGDETRRGVQAAPPRIKDVVPPRLQKLPVFQEGDGRLVDPTGRDRQPTQATTDNSNTQFATLALWVAQRHGIPLERSLRLVVRRFRTSQNADGSWAYRYRYGGSWQEAPAMTCVGLIGLAVGEGLTERPVKQEALDPAILRGFVAMNKHVGTPVPGQAPAQIDLYLLWSIERVAVLYNLPTIGGKDWYRWAAQMLLANQLPAGNWQGGKYHQAHPIIDTCLALLVLKKANLVEDLGKRLPIDPRQLDRAILNTVNPTPSEKPPAPEPPKPVPTPPPVQVTPTPEPNKAATPPAAPVEEAPNGSRRWLLWLVMGGGLLALGGGLVCVLVFRGREDDEDEEEERKPRRRSKPSRKQRAAPA